jgi:hypothetical protein
MPKKETAKEPEVVGVTNETAIAPRGETAIAAIPDFVSEDAATYEGEHIAREDVKIPRIALAQKMSPQLDPGAPEFIEDLRPGQFFNSLTGEILPQPLAFVVLRVERPRFIEFYPRDGSGPRGVKDFNVPIGDPRTEWAQNERGERIPPVATKFHDYIVFLPHDGSVVALSMKGTSIKTARAFNGLRLTRRMPSGPSKGKPAPLYTQVYTLDSKSEKNAKGSYFIFAVRNGGWTWDLGPGFTEQARGLFEALREDTTIEARIDRSVDATTPDEEAADDVSFPHGANAPDPGM